MSCSPPSAGPLPLACVDAQCVVCVRACVRACLRVCDVVSLQMSVDEFYASQWIRHPSVPPRAVAVWPWPSVAVSIPEAHVACSVSYHSLRQTLDTCVPRARPICRRRPLASIGRPALQSQLARLPPALCLDCPRYLRSQTQHVYRCARAHGPAQPSHRPPVRPSVRACPPQQLGWPPLSRQAASTGRARQYRPVLSRPAPSAAPECCCWLLLLLLALLLAVQASPRPLGMPNGLAASRHGRQLSHATPSRRRAATPA
jgi:hypothetical protein